MCSGLAEIIPPFLFTIVGVKSRVYQHRLLKKLGPEPLADDFNAAYLYEWAQKRATIAIKSLLLAAQVVAGIGNIYANEVLFVAKINPLRAAGTLSMKQIRCLVVAIKKILIDAIAHQGSTIRDFRFADDNGGNFQLSHRVYGREGQACCICGESIVRIRLAQRSTFYCRSCQK